ncbi:hypothetical protein B0681_07275 [Moraxella porci DSM 25326]|uniref:Uncharacterized protein n=1 Tax=Moraxella porci DSM 25326 TaxID=573983 RepID=A0A1T0CPP3_9GAMM|nr:hypothetical protein B0681_07275 [Moraxella porci DSM 25326]
MVMKPLSSFKKFKCEKCGKIYVEEVFGSMTSPLFDLFSRTINGIKTKGLCDDCRGYKISNVKNIAVY